MAGSVKRIIGRKLGRGRKRDRASERKRKKRSEGIVRKDLIVKVKGRGGLRRRE